MSKKLLNEGIIEKLIDKIFDSIRDQKMKYVKERLAGDPILVKKLEQIERDRADLYKYLDDNAKKYNIKLTGDFATDSNLILKARINSTMK